MGMMKEFDIRIRSGGDDAIAAVSELMAGRWIPVSERLPEDDEPVLINWTAKGWSCWVGIGWVTKKGNWRDIEGKFPYAVTHWMPLPEPPAPN